jgi:hypothetical protein
MEAALRLIGGDCAVFASGLCSDEPSMSPDAEEPGARWCPPCIARAGLAGTLPDVPEPVKPGMVADDCTWCRGHGYTPGQQLTYEGVPVEETR